MGTGLKLSRLCKDKGVGTSSPQVFKSLFSQSVNQQALNADLLCARLVLKQLFQPIQQQLRQDFSSPANSKRMAAI